MQPTHLRTPLLVPVGEYTPGEYIKSLNAPAQKNYKRVMKSCSNMTFQLADYDLAMMRWFMRLWERQIVGGRNPRWVVTPETFDAYASKGRLLIFTVVRRGLAEIGMFPVERYKTLLYAQPPMYDKGMYPDLARYMWFNMLLWACAQKSVQRPVKYVDLGGGFNGTWRDIICDRKKLSAFRYKWQYVPEKYKDPDNLLPVEDWFVQRCACGWKQLVNMMEVCDGCGQFQARPRSGR